MTSILTAVLLLCAPQPRDWYAEADAAYHAERWAESAAAFERAYEADPQPRYLYGRAQALRRDGECELAIEVYEAFLEVSTSAEADEYAVAAIETCRDGLEAAKPEPPPPVVVTEPSDPAPSPRASGPPPTPWYRDALGHGLTWPGVALAGAGGAMIGIAQRRAAVAEGALSEARYREALDDASALHVGGIATAAVGGVLLVAGVVRFVVVSRRGGRPSGESLVVRF